MYQPVLSRFQSLDPVSPNGVDLLDDNNWFGDRLTRMRNLYGYADNNPVRFVDPGGTERVEIDLNPPINEGKPCFKVGQKDATIAISPKRLTWVYRSSETCSILFEDPGLPGCPTRVPRRRPEELAGHRECETTLVFDLKKGGALDSECRKVGGKLVWFIVKIAGEINVISSKKSCGICEPADIDIG